MKTVARAWIVTSNAMPPDRLLSHYRDLQSYVGWTEEDAARVRSLASVLEPHLAEVISDFYEMLTSHPTTRQKLVGGAAQVERLRGVLLGWLRELLSGTYDETYVQRRWQVGWRHVEIGLAQVYTVVALGHLRSSLCRLVCETYPGSNQETHAVLLSLNKLLDLDLALIQDAYQVEFSARYQAATRLATLGQVAGGVAHELRNPLNVIKTSVYFLRHGRVVTPEQQTEHLHRIERQVDLADKVITSLSNFARMPAPRPQVIAVESIVRDALEDNPPPSSVEVTLDLAPDLPWVVSDRDQLRIVLGNLIRNACDAMPHGGVLHIGARAEGRAVELAIADTGGGIAPEHLSRIMEPLYSTKARGLGLGLAIARSILDKSGGGLTATSVMGRGSTFTVRLPASDSDPGAA